MNEDEKKNIEIFNGNGEGLDISPLYDHINIENPISEENNEQVIIPENIDQSKVEDEQENNDNADNNNNSSTDNNNQ